MKTLLELGDRECRFGVSENEDGEHLFCAAPALDGKPYCARHHHKAHLHGEEKEEELRKLGFVGDPATWGIL